MATIGNNNYSAMADNLRITDIENWLKADNGDETRRLEFSGRTVAAPKSGRKGAKSPLTLQTLKTKNGVANETARQVFLHFVLKQCGVADKEDLPDVVKKAMKLDSLFRFQDWDKGKARPLSARRIDCVLKSIKAYRAASNDAAKKANLEGWAPKNAECKDFWDGLSPKLRKRLLSPDGADLLKTIWGDYRALADKSKPQVRSAFFKRIDEFYGSAAKGASVVHGSSKRSWDSEKRGSDPLCAHITRKMTSSPSVSKSNFRKGSSADRLERILANLKNQDDVVRIQVSCHGLSDGLLTLTRSGKGIRASLVENKLDALWSKTLVKTVKDESKEMDYGKLIEHLKSWTNWEDEEICNVLDKATSAELVKQGPAKRKGQASVVNLGKGIGPASSGGTFLAPENGKPRVESFVTLDWTKEKDGDRECALSQMIVSPIKKFTHGKPTFTGTYKEGARQEVEFVSTLKFGKGWKRPECKVVSCSERLDLPAFESVEIKAK